MTPLRCLVVEDEPLAAALLEDFIGQVGFLRYVGRCPDAMRAADALQTQNVDVIFLDIHLPGLKGLDFLRTLSSPPQTILTTAYHEYALDGYDLNVVDYLLKPIGFERFMRAVQKLKPNIDPPKPAQDFHFFNVNKKMVRVWLHEIAVVESLKEYVRLHLSDGTTLMTKQSLTGMEQMLADYGFVRVHRSFLVAMSHITAYSATEVNTAHLTIPIGRQYKGWELGKLVIC
ncbi:MAG: response regulator transcription factor [Saprospiraceae bacterium]|nr:response regulator transcription factor [Saprospiraceae bacterium]